MSFKKIISLLLSLAIALGLCACTKTKEKIYIAVIAKAINSDFWHNVKNGVYSAATEYNVSVTFEGPENEEDYEAQNAMIVNAVNNGGGGSGGTFPALHIMLQCHCRGGMSCRRLCLLNVFSHVIKVSKHGCTETNGGYFPLKLYVFFYPLAKVPQLCIRERLCSAAYKLVRITGR